MNYIFNPYHKHITFLFRLRSKTIRKLYVPYLRVSWSIFLLEDDVIFPVECKNRIWSAISSVFKWIFEVMSWDLYTHHWLALVAKSAEQDSGRTNQSTQNFYCCDFQFNGWKWQNQVSHKFSSKKLKWLLQYNLKLNNVSNFEVKHDILNVKIRFFIIFNKRWPYNSILNIRIRSNF